MLFYTSSTSLLQDQLLQSRKMAWAVDYQCQGSRQKGLGGEVQEGSASSGLAA